jgi:hypothetical protein
MSQKKEGQDGQKRRTGRRAIRRLCKKRKINGGSDNEREGQGTTVV